MKAFLILAFDKISNINKYVGSKWMVVGPS